MLRNRKNKLHAPESEYHHRGRTQRINLGKAVKCTRLESALQTCTRTFKQKAGSERKGFAHGQTVSLGKH